MCLVAWRCLSLQIMTDNTDLMICMLFLPETHVNCTYLNPACMQWVFHTETTLQERT